MRNTSIVQGAQLGALYDLQGWDGGGRREVYILADLFTSLYSRN